MSNFVDIKIIEQLLKVSDINQIQYLFEILMNNVVEYLGLQPIYKNVKIKILLVEKLESSKKSHVLDLGVNRIYRNNSQILEIYEKDRKFLPFILLREAFYNFLPSEIKDNNMIKVYINQIVENNLENVVGFKNWHNSHRDALVDQYFLTAQLDKLKKFFKIETSKEHETPTQFFFNEVRVNASIIGNREINNYYDELFEKYMYKTSKSLYNEDIIKTLLILLKTFTKNKKYVSITDYLELYRNMLENEEIESTLSLRKFYENLQWINKFTSIAPSYNVVHNLIGLSPIFCELIFNPVLEKQRIMKLIRNLPFMASPRIIENNFGCRFVITFIIPTTYQNDLVDYFNRLQTLGYLYSKRVILYKTVWNFLNLNYYLESPNTSKIIDPLLKNYNKDFECEHKIEFTNERNSYPLSLFNYIILGRIRDFSVTGLTFDKRVETLNALKEDMENEYRKQLNSIENFREIFNKLMLSPKTKEDFLSFLNQNQKRGILALHENLLSILEFSASIEKLIAKNPTLINLHQLKLFLEENSLSQILEKNLILRDHDLKKVVFNDILPKYFRSINLYRQELSNIRLFYDLISSFFSLKVFSIKAINNIVRNPQIIDEIIKKKEERIRKAFKLVKSGKITNQRIESALDELLTHDPPIIIPFLINTIMASQIAKFYPEICLKNSIRIQKTLRKFKAYFPRILTSKTIDLDTRENSIHLLCYSVNFKEKGDFISSLYNLFGKDIMTVRRNFWRGLYRISKIRANDFYDFENKQFFYTKDFFEQFLVYTRSILGTNKLISFNKKENSSRVFQFWSPSVTMESLVNTIKKRLSHQKLKYNFDLINNLIMFRNNLESILINQKTFMNVKSAEFYSTYIKSIKFIPAFRAFGLAKYYLYFFPHDWDEIDIKLLLINSFQSIKYPAQIDPNQPIFIKSLFPYRTPNKSYINWLIQSKKAIRECCHFFIKKVYDITHFDHSLSSRGWHYSSNRFKIHTQNVLFDPNYTHQMQNIREFDIDDFSNSEVHGLQTPEFEALTQIYNRHSIDIKSFLGTNKFPTIKNITSLLKKKLIFPYLNLKNLDVQDKITLILPSVKIDLNKKLVSIFSFFNTCRIYEIEGDLYIHGFQELKSFETGYMIEIWFPKCELDEFFDVFDLLFEFLEIKHYLILTDLVNGETLLKNIFGDLKFLKDYNPLFNLKWNKKDKIWMNHKLFTKDFEPIYPNLIPKD